MLVFIFDAEVHIDVRLLGGSLFPLPRSCYKLPAGTAQAIQHELGFLSGETLEKSIIKLPYLASRSQSRSNSPAVLSWGLDALVRLTENICFGQ